MTAKVEGASAVSVANDRRRLRIVNRREEACTGAYLGAKESSRLPLPFPLGMVTRLPTGSGAK